MKQIFILLLIFCSQYYISNAQDSLINKTEKSHLYFLFGMNRHVVPVMPEVRADIRINKFLLNASAEYVYGSKDKKDNRRLIGGSGFYGKAGINYMIKFKGETESHKVYNLNDPTHKEYSASYKYYHAHYLGVDFSLEQTKQVYEAVSLNPLIVSQKPFYKGTCLYIMPKYRHVSEQLVLDDYGVTELALITTPTFDQLGAYFDILLHLKRYSMSYGVWVVRRYDNQFSKIESDNYSYMGNKWYISFRLNVFGFFYSNK